MALTPDEELELIDIELEQLRLQKQKASVQQPTPASPAAAAPLPAAPQAPVAAPAPQPAEPSFTDRLTSNPLKVLNPVLGLNQTLGETALPYLKEAADFYQREVGAPVIGKLHELDPMTALTKGTALEPLRRSVLAPLTGEDWANASTSKEGAAALDSFSGSLPGVGGTSEYSPSAKTMSGVLKGAAQGVLPSVATGGVSGSVGAASRFGPGLSRLLGVAAEGAVGGGVEGLLIKSQDPQNSAIAGAVLGPVMDLGLQGAAKLGGKVLSAGKKVFGKAAQAAPPPPETIGLITPQAKKQVVDEAFEAAALPPEPKTTVDEAGVDMALRTKAPPGRAPDAPLPQEVAAAVDTPATVKAADIETPFAARVRLDADGNPVLSILEVKRGAVPRAADMPLSTHAERSKAFSYMWKKGLEMADIGEDALRSPRTQQFFDELQLYKEERAIANPIDRTPIKELDDFFAKKHPGKVAGELEYDAKANRFIQKPKAKVDTSPPPPDPDAPVGPPVEKADVLSIKQHADGSLSTSRDDIATNPGKLSAVTPSNRNALTERELISITGGPRQADPHTNQNNTLSRVAAEPPPPKGPPNGGGPPPPPSKPPPPMPGDIPPPKLEGMQTVLGAIDKMSRQPGLAERTLRQLVGSHLRGPKDAGELILMHRAQATLEKTAADVYNHLRTLVPKKDRFGFDKEFARYAAGEHNSHVLRQKYPKAWAQVEEYGNKLLQERDVMDAELRRLGFLPDDLAPLIDSGAFDKYLARSYLAYVLPPGEWAKYARKHPDLIENAAAYFKGKFPKWSDAELAAELTRIMQAQDPLDAFAGSPLHRHGKAKNALLKREDIPEPVRKLLGEIESGTFKLATSIGNQRALLANARMWTEIVANPELFSPVPIPGVSHPVPLPASPRHFGPAAGGYVTPHLYEALVNVPKAIESGPQWLRSIIGFTKGNEVALGGAGPWLNATVGNTFWYSPLAGGISPTNPGHMGKYLFRAMQELRKYGKDPVGDGWVMSAKKYGTDASGVGGLEFDPTSNPAEELFGDLLKSDKPLTGMDVLAGWGKRISHGLKKGYGSVGRKYDLIDRTFKLANFMAIVDREVAKGLDVHAAMKHASYRVNQSFPAPDKMGPIPQRISRGMPGLFAKYGTFFMEDLRVNAMLPQRLLEEPDLRWRLAGMGVLMGGLFGYNSLNRYMAGISQDEIDKVEASLSDGKKHHHPLTFVAGWRDAKGRPQVWDLTQFVPLGRLLSGHPDDAAYRRILGNLVTGGFDSGVAENEVQGFLARTGLVRPVRQPQDMLAGEDRTLQALQMAWDFGLAPKAPERVYEALRRAEAFGPIGPASEPFTPGQAGAKMLGLPTMGGVDVNGGPSQMGTNFEFMAAEKEFERQLRSAANRSPEQALPFLQQLYRAIAFDSKDAHKEAKLKAIQEAFIREAKRMEERQRILGGKK